MVDLFLIANFSATMETVKEAYEKPAEGSVDSFVYDGPFYSIMHQEKGRELSK